MAGKINRLQEENKSMLEEEKWKKEDVFCLPEEKDWKTEEEK